MTYELGDVIEHLPRYTEPVSVVSVEIYRDGGSVEVILNHSTAQRIELWFDSCYGSVGRPYLQLPDNQRPSSCFLARRAAKACVHLFDLQR